MKKVAPLFVASLLCLASCNSGQKQSDEAIEAAKEFSAAAQANAKKVLEQANKAMEKSMAQAQKASDKAAKQMNDMQNQVQANTPAQGTSAVGK